MKKVKIALISIGNHCKKNIIPCLNKMNNVEVVGFYTRNKESAMKVSQVFGFSFYNDLEKLLMDSACDFVYISSPNATHSTYIKEAIRHNKSTIVEKTAITDLLQAEDLIAEANRKNLLIYEAFMFRHHKQFLRIKEIIDERVYGAPKRIFVNFGFPHLDVENIRYQADLGGGALLDAGAYTIACVNNLLGKGALECSALSFGDYDIDISGYCTFKHNSEVYSFLNWGFGLGYLNEMQIWTDDQLILADRIFSKPATYPATIFTIKNGIKTVDSQFVCNHFEEMFNYVLRLDKSEYRKVNANLLDQLRVIDQLFKKHQK